MRGHRAAALPVRGLEQLAFLKHRAPCARHKQVDDLNIRAYLQDNDEKQHACGTKTSATPFKNSLCCFSRLRRKLKTSAAETALQQQKEAHEKLGYFGSIVELLREKMIISGATNAACTCAAPISLATCGRSVITCAAWEPIRSLFNALSPQESIFEGSSIAIAASIPSWHGCTGKCPRHADSP